MQKKKIPCQTGESCASCWNSDACQLYKYRKKEQQEKEQKEKERKEKERLEEKLSEQIEKEQAE
jgi:hypothetical protein